jgi:pantetheine-phosphate adenylyltransferase
MAKTALFPGTFDPPTLGHTDIILRSSRLFDKLYVAVGKNIEKRKPAFTVEKRIEMLKLLTADLKNVEIVEIEGLVADMVKKMEITALIRSIRTISEIEYETALAQMNRQMSGVDTLFISSDERYRLISSSLVREVAHYGKRLHPFVPAQIEDMVFNALYDQKGNT